jgi:hypothetical protein
MKCTPEWLNTDDRLVDKSLPKAYREDDVLLVAGTFERHFPQTHWITSLAHGSTGSLL